MVSYLKSVNIYAYFIPYVASKKYSNVVVRIEVYFDACPKRGIVEAYFIILKKV